MIFETAARDGMVVPENVHFLSVNRDGTYRASSLYDRAQEPAPDVIDPIPGERGSDGVYRVTTLGADDATDAGPSQLQSGRLALPPGDGLNVVEGQVIPGELPPAAGSRDFDPFSGDEFMPTDRGPIRWIQQPQQQNMQGPVGPHGWDPAADVVQSEAFAYQDVFQSWLPENRNNALLTPDEFEGLRTEIEGAPDASYVRDQVARKLIDPNFQDLVGAYSRTSRDYSDGLGDPFSLYDGAVEYLIMRRLDSNAHWDPRAGQAEPTLDEVANHLAGLDEVVSPRDTQIMDMIDRQLGDETFFRAALQGDPGAMEQVRDSASALRR